MNYHFNYDSKMHWFAFFRDSKTKLRPYLRHSWVFDILLSTKTKFLCLLNGYQAIIYTKLSDELNKIWYNPSPDT